MIQENPVPPTEATSSIPALNDGGFTRSTINWPPVVKHSSDDILSLPASALSSTIGFGHITRSSVRSSMPTAW